MRGRNLYFTMNNNRLVEQVYNAFWILFGIGICVQSIRYGIWNPAGPGSGFIPFLTGLLIGGTGLLLYVGERPKASKEEEGNFWENRTAMKRVLYLVASLCIMAFLMLKLGFLITSVLGTILLIRIMEPKKWVTVIITSIGSCLFLYFLFHSIIKINLPKGFLGF